MIVFEDCPNQWSLSRPLLALILTNDAFYAQVISPLPLPGSVSPCVVCPLTTNGAFYAQWRGTVLQQQAQAGSAERQAKLGAAFDKLMQVLLPLPSGASAPPAGAHAPPLPPSPAMIAGGAADARGEEPRQVHAEPDALPPRRQKPLLRRGAGRLERGVRARSDARSEDLREG